MKTKKILLSFVSIISLWFSGVTLNSCGKSPSINDLIFLPITEEGKIGFSEYEVYGKKSISSTDIIIPSKYNGITVTEIGSRAFAGCGSLESIVIPNGVTSIGGAAFADCYSLKTITIPRSVTTIDYAAFARCSSLRVVFYKGSAKRWANIDIYGLNQCLTDATIVFK